MYVRRFEKKDAQEAAELIRRSLMEVNIKDYAPEEMERIAQGYCDVNLCRIAEEGHMYVVCSEKQIIGTGAVRQSGEKGNECEIITVFVHPEFLGRKVGRQIIEALEADEWCLEAQRVRLDASVTAHRFYEKMGYGYVNGKQEMDENRLYPMEKICGRHN